MKSHDHVTAGDGLYHKDIFSADALAIVHEAAASSLRDTDRIATAALRAAARKKKKLVERDVLTRILQAESEDRS